MRKAFLPVGLIVATALAGSATGDPKDPGVTDFTRTNPTEIRATDIVKSLSETRQTAIRAAEPSPAPERSGSGRKASHHAPQPTERSRVMLPIYFEFRTTEPTPDSRKVLEALGDALNSAELAGSQFLIEGHTDSIGSDTYNQTLSTERADVVRVYLEQHGIAGGRLRAVGRGESDPVASNDSDEGRQRNRRVDLVRLGSAN